MRTQSIWDRVTGACNRLSSDWSLKYRSLLDHRTALVVGLSILSIDVILICFYLVQNAAGYFDVDVGIFGGKEFALNYDRGYAEFFNYVQTAFLVIILTMIAAKTRQIIFLCWGIVYLIVLGDDSFRIHEELGGAIATRLGLTEGFGLRGQDFGELIAWSILAIPAISVLVYGFRNTSKDYEVSSWMLGVAFTALVAFAVGVDMIHSILKPSIDEVIDNMDKVINITAIIVEDGGEMIAISVAAIIALAIYITASPGVPADN